MKKKGPDYILIATVLLIILLGLFVLASVSSIRSQEAFEDPYYFFYRQLLTGFLPGLIVALLLYKIPLSFIKKWSPVFFILSLVSLALIFVPYIGEGIRGSARWINLYFFSFQPSEILKLTFILYLAGWLAEKGKSKKNKEILQTALPFVIMSAVMGVMFLLQKDASTLGVILLTALIVYFAAETPLWHTGALLLSGAGIFLLILKFSPVRLRRIYGMFDVNLDPLGSTYQIRQALIAIGSGGVLGAGFGMSHQKYGFLPLSMTDSIFAIFAEETGFVGSALLIILFLILTWRGIVIAKNSNSQFVRLVSVGITSWFFIQAFVNIGSMVGLMPLTGIPLPLISYGRSHIIAEMAALGVLLNASKNEKKV